MCGIVGYVGRRAAAPILLAGLGHLEYRGYDSAGLAIHDGRDLSVVRAVGKLARLSEAVAASPPPGTTGIGHTRWATHGAPTVANAHPHAVGQVAVVHNGIIENHASLRSELRRAGAVFSSETDTEVVAHLVDRALASGAPDLLSAVRIALRRLEGAYAIAVVARSAPDVVVVAKHRSPLVVGLADGEAHCASDVPALLAHTRDVVVLEDGDIAELHPRGVRFSTIDGHDVERPLRRVEGTRADAEKGSYPHFMLKEIHEQPDAVESSLRGRLDLDAGLVNAGELGIPVGLPTSIDRVTLVACGTSHHASMAGRHWIERLARLPATCELASEVRDRDPVLGPRDLVIAVSQSGETADTLAAVEAAKRRGAKVLAITNVVESAIPRAADCAVYTHAGPEIGVASTKCFTTQLSAMLLVAIHLGLECGALRRARARELLLALDGVPARMRRMLAKTDAVVEAANDLAAARDVLYLGRGLGFPIALEGALKLKEVSYVHAEGYAAGEMKHGPIALIDGRTPVVVVAPRDAQHAKVASNMAEVRARGGRVLAVHTEGDDATAESAFHALPVPVAVDDVLPLLTVVPLQLLAYHTAIAKGTDVDQPRNLAKTVTVE